MIQFKPNLLPIEKIPELEDLFILSSKYIQRYHNIMDVYDVTFFTISFIKYNRGLDDKFL